MSPANSQPKAHTYRVVQYVVNPYSSFLVPLAAVVDGPDGTLSVVGKVPGPDCLGSDAAHSHIVALMPHLGRLDSMDELPEFLGPHFVLSDRQEIPDGAPCETWVRETVFRRDPATGTAKKDSGP